MNWRQATQDESVAMRKMLNKMKLVNVNHGKFNHENLYLHINEVNDVTGLVYFLPDTYCTVIEEIWLAFPYLIHCLKSSLEKICIERKWNPFLIGHVDLLQADWIRALQERGAKYDSIKMQLTWRIPCEVLI